MTHLPPPALNPAPTLVPVLVGRRATVVMGLLALLALAGLAVWVAWGGSDGVLTVAKAWQGQFVQAMVHHPVALTAAYFGVFVLVTACCLPGAGVLLLVSGAAFGVVGGSLLGVLASSVGATLTMLAVRQWVAPAVEARFAHRLPALRAAVQQDGSWLLLSLRLAPVIPFVPLNLMAGVVPIRVWTFFWVSTLGMLPSTVVYVLAGAQLATVHSMGEVLSLPVLGSLLFLAMLPWVGRLAVRGWRRAHPSALNS